MEELQPEASPHRGGRQQKAAGPEAPDQQAAGPEPPDLPGEEAAVHQGAGPAPAEAAQSITITIEDPLFPTGGAEDTEGARGLITFGLLLWE